MSGGLLPTQNMSVGVSHKAPMPGDQTHIPCVPLGSHAWQPSSSSQWFGPCGPGCLPLIQKAFVETGQPAPVPGGSGVSQGLSAPIPVGHPFSAARTCEDDEEEVSPSQGVSVFLHLIGQVKAYLHLPSPEAPSSSQLMGIERAQGSAFPCQSSLTLKLSVRKPNVGP
ncbi:hypothetical protein E2C01_021879 [Portunus trituberculatus]|uniref:Uncharacterized protein n=1 Tax=Portunus trituberculatus TaxID=210409 RepID=A0A5B7E5J0_PORTR|nr:hypothetical protein [Portunus trituberculatus]